MKKTVEEPDLVPGSRGLHWTPRFGNALQTAIIQFCIRSLARSRQHRVALAFYLAIIFAIALSSLEDQLSPTPPREITIGFIIPTFTMMAVAVFGFRSVFSLPISLNANWVLRITQLRPSEEYIATTMRTLLLFAVMPVCLITAALSFCFRPWSQVLAHLVLLALLGCVFGQLSMIGFYKVPFTCSYLPGKANFQLVFWGFLIGMVAFALPYAQFEQSAIRSPVKLVCMVSALTVAAFSLWDTQSPSLEIRGPLL